MCWVDSRGLYCRTPWNDSDVIFRWNDSGLGLKVRVTAQKSELQPESQSYSRVDPPNLNQIARNRCLNRILVVLQKRALKPSWIHPRYVQFFCVDSIPSLEFSSPLPFSQVNSMSRMTHNGCSQGIDKGGKYLANSVSSFLILFSLLFGFPFFFSRNSLFFWASSLYPQAFRGSTRIKSPCFCGDFPCL